MGFIKWKYTRSLHIEWKIFKHVLQFPQVFVWTSKNLVPFYPFVGRLPLSHKVETQYVYFKLHANYISFFLERFLKKLVDDQSCSRTKRLKDSIYHTNHLSTQHFCYGCGLTLMDVYLKYLYHVWLAHTTFLIYQCQRRETHMHRGQSIFLMIDVIIVIWHQPDRADTVGKVINKQFYE